MYDSGCRVFLELGPRPTLTSLRTALPEAHVVWESALDPRRSDCDQTLSCLRTLYESGVTIDWQAFYRGENSRKVSLPTYPFQRKRLWCNPYPSRPNGG